MNAEDLIAMEAGRLGRPLTAEEKARIRAMTALERATYSYDVTREDAREATASTPDSGGVAGALDAIVNAPRELADEAAAYLPADAVAGLDAASGYLESGSAPSTGMVSGATLGFNDELGGALANPAGAASALSRLLGAPGAVGSEGDEAEYVRERDRLRGIEERDREEHPYATTAGDLIGGLVTAPLTPGIPVGNAAATAARAARAAGTSLNPALRSAARAESALRLGGAALTGAGYGGLAGLGASEGDTLGEVGGDALRAAGAGGVIGGGLGALGEAGMGLARSVPSWRESADAALVAVPAGGNSSRVKDLLLDLGGVGMDTSRAADRIRATGTVGPLSAPADVHEVANSLMDPTEAERILANMPLEEGGIDPERIAAAIESVLEEYPNPNERASLSSLQAWLDDMRSRSGYDLVEGPPRITEAEGPPAPRSRRPRMAPPVWEPTDAVSPGDLSPMPPLEGPPPDPTPPSRGERATGADGVAGRRGRRVEPVSIPESELGLEPLPEVSGRPTVGDRALTLPAHLADDPRPPQIPPPMGGGEEAITPRWRAEVPDYIRETPYRDLPPPPEVSLGSGVATRPRAERPLGARPMGARVRRPWYEDVELGDPPVLTEPVLEARPTRIPFSGTGDGRSRPPDSAMHVLEGLDDLADYRSPELAEVARAARKARSRTRDVFDEHIGETLGPDALAEHRAARRDESALAAIRRVSGASARDLATGNPWRDIMGGGMASGGRGGALSAILRGGLVHEARSRLPAIRSTATEAVASTLEGMEPTLVGGASLSGRPTSVAGARAGGDVARSRSDRRDTMEALAAYRRPPEAPAAHPAPTPPVEPPVEAAPVVESPSPPARRRSRADILRDLESYRRPR